MKKGILGYLHMGDYRKLPKLMTAQKELSRKDIKEFIYQARDRAWFYREIVKRNKLITCKYCNRHYFANTQYQAFNWSSRSRQLDVVISQRLMSIQIRPALVQLDFGKLVDTQKAIDN